MNAVDVGTHLVLDHVALEKVLLPLFSTRWLSASELDRMMETM